MVKALLKSKATGEEVNLDKGDGTLIKSKGETLPFQKIKMAGFQRYRLHAHI